MLRKRTFEYIDFVRRLTYFLYHIKVFHYSSAKHNICSLWVWLNGIPIPRITRWFLIVFILHDKISALSLSDTQKWNLFPLYTVWCYICIQKQKWKTSCFTAWESTFLHDKSCMLCRIKTRPRFVDVPHCVSLYKIPWMLYIVKY